MRYRHPEVEIRSELAVPLIFRDQLIGVIDLESTELRLLHGATRADDLRPGLEHRHRAGQRPHARAGAARRAAARARPGHGAGDPARVAAALDATSVAGLEIGTAYIPARELGGDFYDFLRYPNGCLAFAVGDAAGKATPAALMASTAVGMLRGHVMEQPGEPAAILRELNAQLETITAEGRFVAMVAMAYGLYDERAGKLHLANAGSAPPAAGAERRDRGRCPSTACLSGCCPTESTGRRACRFRRETSW